MDGQQLGLASADRIVTRDLAPTHRFSYLKEGMVAWGIISLPFFVLSVAFIPAVLVPTGWALLAALGIGGAIYFQLGIYRFASAHAWKPFQAARRTEAGEVLQEFAGRPLARWDGDAGHAEAGGVCWATGVAWDGQFLYVLDKGVGARIPLAAVREWRWSADRAGTSGWFAVGGMVQAMQAQNEALDADARNRQAVNAGNGLFLSVRSVDRPVWQFQTSDEPTLRRWAEVLNQVFEGQPPPPAPVGVDLVGDAAPSRTEPRPTGTAPAKGGPGQWKLLGMLLLGVLLFAVAALAAGAMSAYLFGMSATPASNSARPANPNAYLSGSLDEVRKHIRRQAWGSDAGALDPGHDMDRHEQVKGRVNEAFLNRSLLAHSLAMPAGDRKREFLRTFCGEVLRQELTEALAESGHLERLRGMVFVSPEGKTFDNGKLLSPQVLQAVSQERARLPSLASLRRCNEDIPFGME